jgi:hypothetical protein
MVNRLTNATVSSQTEQWTNSFILAPDIVWLHTYWALETATTTTSC